MNEIIEFCVVLGIYPAALALWWFLGGSMAAEILRAFAWALAAVGVLT